MKTRKYLTTLSKTWDYCYFTFHLHLSVTGHK